MTTLVMVDQAFGLNMEVVEVMVRIVVYFVITIVPRPKLTIKMVLDYPYSPTN